MVLTAQCGNNYLVQHPQPPNGGAAEASCSPRQAAPPTPIRSTHHLSAMSSQYAFAITPVFPSLCPISLSTTCPLAATRVPRMSAATPSTTLDPLFSRLRHINKNLRVKASAELARLPPEDTVPRLVALLGEAETDYRRAAVQTLGMIGAPAVSQVVEKMEETDDITVRASCSKALAAVAMYFPLDRANFSSSALDTMESLLDDGVDPVTKIATVGCLTTLACDAKVAVGESVAETEAETLVVPASETDGEGVVTAIGSERALGMLLRMLEGSGDVALAASLTGALAQVANCGTPERKKDIVERLRAIAERDGAVGDGDEDGGFGYVQEMCRNHVSQLEGSDVP